MTPLSSRQQSEHRYQQPVSNTAVNYQASRDALSFPAAFILAIIAHGLVIALIAITLTLLSFFGFKIPLFEPAGIKPRDIEFVLVDNVKPEPPRNKNTRNRADRMSRSGGQKVVNKPQAVPQRAAGTPSPKQAARAAQKPSPQKASPRPRITPRPTPKPQPNPFSLPPAPTPQPKKETPAPTPPQPQAPQPRPNQANAPTLPPSPTSPNIKVPLPASNPRAVNSGPIVSSNSGPSGSSQAGGGPGAIGPQAIPGNLSRNLGSGRPGATGSRGGTGGAGGTGAYTTSGSPGGGGGRPGIDAMPEPDFGPYIAELQRRIKRNWNPPSSDRSKRVIAIFTVGRAGQLLAVRLKNTSGSPSADQAAVAAVRASAPFRSLPANFRGNQIDIEFTFDYDVYTGGRLSN